MGLLTINLPEDVIKELKKCGAYVPDLIIRAVARELKEARSNSSTTPTMNIELRRV